MSKNLLSIIITSFALSLSAQITVSPNPLALVGPASQVDIKYEMYFTNTKDTTYTIYWQLVKDNTFPVQWSTYICDLEQCYLENVDKSSNNLPNKFTPGTHNFQLHLRPGGFSANTTITLKLFTAKNMQGEILSVPITLATNSSSVKDIDPSQIKIFPNPASDYFQIGNAQDVDRIVIYNIIGKEVKSLFHYNNAHHEINDLKTGMYVVKMFDDKGKVIKSIKLSKIFEGA